MDPRYLVVFGACVTQFTIVGLLFSVGLFFNVLEEELGWSRTLLSGSTSLAFLVMGVLAFFVGRLSDRYGPSVVLGTAGLLYGIGYGLISVVGEPWQLIALFGIFIGLGLSAHDVVTLSTIARWFEHRRGMMTGVVKVGTAAGQMVLPPLTALLMAGLGWRNAVLVLGGAAAVLLLVAALSMKRPPESRSSDSRLPDNRSSDSRPPGPRTGGAGAPEFAEVRRSRAFWTLCATQFLFFPSLVTVPLHVAVHGMDLGLTHTTAATLLTVIGGASIVGRLTVGASVDRIGGRNAYVLCFVPLLIGLLSLLVVETPWLLFPAVAVYGFAHGGFFTVVSPAIAELFGTRAHGAIFGGVVFFGTIGAAVGPILAGRVFDVTGSYAWAFTGLAVMGALGLVLAISLPPRRPAPLARP